MDVGTAGDVWRDFQPGLRCLWLHASTFQLVRAAGPTGFSDGEAKPSVEGLAAIDQATLEVIGVPDSRARTINFAIQPYASHEEVLASMLWSWGTIGYPQKPVDEAESRSSATLFSNWLLSRQFAEMESGKPHLFRLDFDADRSTFHVLIYIPQAAFQDLVDDMANGRVTKLSMSLSSTLLSTKRNIDYDPDDRRPLNVGMLKSLTSKHATHFGEEAALYWRPEFPSKPVTRSVGELLEAVRALDAKLEAMKEQKGKATTSAIYDLDFTLDSTNRWLIAGVVGVWVAVIVMAVSVLMRG
jgi:hypothetical protein